MSTEITKEELKGIQETAQNMVYNSVIEYINMSAEFYAKSAEEYDEKNDEHMRQHCIEMMSAYKEMSTHLKRFKFIGEF